MDAYPLGMGPGAHVDDRRQPVGVQVASSGIALVQRGDRPLQPPLEGGELGRHLCRRRSFPATDLNPRVLEPGLAPKATDVYRMRDVQPGHRGRLPSARSFQRGNVPAERAVADIAEDLGEITSQRLAVFVPISHAGVLGSWFAQDPLSTVADPPRDRRGQEQLRPRHTVRWPIRNGGPSAGTPSSAEVCAPGRFRRRRMFSG